MCDVTVMKHLSEELARRWEAEEDPLRFGGWKPLDADAGFGVGFFINATEDTTPLL